MTSVVADTHALLWMLKGSLRDRSPNAADAVDRALRAKTLLVVVGAVLMAKRPARVSSMTGRS